MDRLLLGGRHQIKVGSRNQEFRTSPDPDPDPVANSKQDNIDIKGEDPNDKNINAEVQTSEQT